MDEQERKNLQEVANALGMTPAVAGFINDRSNHQVPEVIEFVKAFRHFAAFSLRFYRQNNAKALKDFNTLIELYKKVEQSASDFRARAEERLEQRLNEMRDAEPESHEDANFDAHMDGVYG